MSSISFNTFFNSKYAGCFIIASASFNFSGSDQQKKLNAISGGERNRVHLARMLKEGANVLLKPELLREGATNTTSPQP